MRIDLGWLLLPVAAIPSCSAGDNEDGSGGGDTGGREGSGGRHATGTTLASNGGQGGSSIDDPRFAAPTSTVSEWITAGYYTCETEQSACALPCSSGDLWVAINETDFRNSATCGACMHVVGPRGEVTVEVIENCGDACVDGEIELSRTAFDTIGDLDEGHADVTWELVPCAHSTPIEFAYEADSDEWWAGIQVRNSNLPVASLFIALPEQGVTELERDGWNHFPVSADLGSGPFDFRVVAIDGQELLETDVAYVPGGVVVGTGQFEP